MHPPHQGQDVEVMHKVSGEILKTDTFLRGENLDLMDKRFSEHLDFSDCVAPEEDLYFVIWVGMVNVQGFSAIS